MTFLPSVQSAFPPFSQNVTVRHYCCFSRSPKIGEHTIKKRENPKEAQFEWGT